MAIKFKRILFRLLGGELLLKGLAELLSRVLTHFREEIKKTLAIWATKAAFFLLLWTLARCAVLFALVALALYFNTLMSSTYLGFLVVSAGCIAFIFFALLLSQIRWGSKK